MALCLLNFESKYPNGNTEVSTILPDRPRKVEPQDFYTPEKKYRVLWLARDSYPNSILPAEPMTSCTIWYLPFKKYAGEIGLKATFEEFEGYGHEWRFWDLAIRRALDLFCPLETTRGNQY